MQKVPRIEAGYLLNKGIERGVLNDGDPSVQ